MWQKATLKIFVYLGVRDDRATHTIKTKTYDIFRISRKNFKRRKATVDR
jgi:hypothetical protein